MLINCVAYQDGRKLADVAVPDISDYVARGDCFVWVALRDGDATELAVMQEEFGLHELAVEDASRGHQRPKIEEYGDSLFVVVKTVEAQGDELVVGEVDVFVGPNYVLSNRQNSSQDLLGVRARAEREPHLLRIAGTLDSIRDTISTAIQVHLSMVAIDEGEVNKKLAAYAAIFAVMTAFAGIWGMNFKYMPELDSPYGYPAALVLMITVCCYLYRRFRKAGWL